VVWLNAAANALGQTLGFIGFMPGWLSATLIAVVSGIAMIVAFKWTSNQKAIKRARQDIRASLLTVKLFHDNMRAGFRAQSRVLLGAMRLLVFALVPILAMLAPMSLLLGQLALWYQARPLRIGEEAVIVLKLGGDAGAPMPTATLDPTNAIADVHGPIRIAAQREVCWNVRAREDGLHRLVFRVGGYPVEKELAVGDGFMRVSLRRPDWHWSDALFHPREAPFDPGSAVRCIDVAYPPRSSWTSGTDYWLYYWFAVSLLAGFLLPRLFQGQPLDVGGRCAGARQAGNNDDLGLHIALRRLKVDLEKAAATKTREQRNGEPVIEPIVRAARPRRARRVGHVDAPHRRAGVERGLARMEQGVGPVPIGTAEADAHEAVADG